MVTSKKKGLKIGRALRSAALLPIRVSAGRGSGRNAFLPGHGEAPVVVLRVQIISCQDLEAKDRNGFSDPYVLPYPSLSIALVVYPHALSSFVTVSVLSTRFQTPVCKRTLSPVYAAKDATFDFPIYMSLADKLGVLEFVVWDKEMLKKEYMGEHALPLDEWFKGIAFSFDDPDNQVCRFLQSKDIRAGNRLCPYSLSPLPSFLHVQPLPQAVLCTSKLALSTLSIRRPFPILRTPTTH
jgi:phosphatidylserine decarboxylase